LAETDSEYSYDSLPHGQSGRIFFIYFLIQVPNSTSKLNVIFNDVQIDLVKFWSLTEPDYLSLLPVFI